MHWRVNSIFIFIFYLIRIWLLVFHLLFQFFIAILVLVVAELGFGLSVLINYDVFIEKCLNDTLYAGKDQVLLKNAFTATQYNVCIDWIIEFYWINVKLSSCDCIIFSMHVAGSINQLIGDLYSEIKIHWYYHQHVAHRIGQSNVMFIMQYKLGVKRKWANMWRNFISFGLLWVSPYQ